MEAFGITRSLSQAGWSYEHAVAESTYRAFKMEFVYQETFQSLEELVLRLKTMFIGGITTRIHGSLNYQTPMTKRLIA
ncbi:ISSag4, transposase orfB [Streptococcus iniae SF1]|nr:ISSag4, transposase orfB [Streptococcus iniae SF1]